MAHIQFCAVVCVRVEETGRRDSNNALITIHVFHLENKVGHVFFDFITGVVEEAPIVLFTCHRLFRVGCVHIINELNELVLGHGDVRIAGLDDGMSNI